MFYSHIPAGKLVSLLMCFVLSLVLIVGSVSSSATFSSSSSPYAILTKAFADDMMGGGVMPSPQDAPATTDATTDAPSGHDGDDEDDEDNTPATTDTLTAGPTGGNRGDGDDGEDDDDDDDGGVDNNQKKQASNEGPKATALGSCSPGEERNIFTNECKPTLLAQNPANTGPNTLTPTVCGVSYSQYEKESTPLLAKSKGSTLLKHFLEYTAMQAPLLTRVLQQDIGPHIHLVGDPFFDFIPTCKTTDSRDSTTGIQTRTVEDLKDGSKSVAQKDRNGNTFSHNKFKKDGSLISSQVGSNIPDPNSGNTAVSVQKGGKKDVTIAMGTTPISKFTMTKSGKIASSDPKVTSIEEVYDKKRLKQTLITGKEGVTIQVNNLNLYGAKPGTMSIQAKGSDGSLLTDTIMIPDGTLIKQ